MREDNMERGFYRIYLESGGIKTPYITYALNGDQAAARALDHHSDELPHAQVREVQGPFTSMAAMEGC